jgi:hypothetical protein
MTGTGEGLELQLYSFLPLALNVDAMPRPLYPREWLDGSNNEMSNP